MSGRLPQQIDPIRLADEGGHLAGEIPGREFTRLQDHGLADNEPVQIDLRFEKLAGGGRRLRGAIRARFETRCQRCLELMALEVEARPDIVLLTGNATAPDEIDALTVDGPVRLVELIEDESLLAMPMIPMHEADRCSTPASVTH